MSECECACVCVRVCVCLSVAKVEIDNTFTVNIFWCGILTSFDYKYAYESLLETVLRRDTETHTHMQPYTYTVMKYMLCIVFFLKVTVETFTFHVSARLY